MRSAHRPADDLLELRRPRRVPDVHDEHAARREPVAEPAQKNSSVSRGEKGMYGCR